MTGLDGLLFVFGTAVAKTACSLWAGNNKLLNEVEQQHSGPGGCKASKFKTAAKV